MIPHFVNRTVELEFLERKYNESENSPQMVVLYGKRRVGKTELIKKFMLDKEKKGTYILCTSDSMSENIEEMKRKFHELTGKDYFLDLDVTSFFDLFRYLSQEMGTEKAVIAIDEFPYLIEMNRGVVSVFQKICDELLVHNNLLLIICGSSIGMMETEVLGYKSPLYGRRTGEWNVKPLPFKHMKHFFDNYDTTDLFRIWAMCGGVPYYLQKLDPDKSIEANIKQRILTKGEVLYNEPRVLLKEEFREPRTYTLILKYLSLGYNTHGKISSVTGIEKGNLSKYLSVLEDLHIIEHILSLGMRKRGIYEINDQYFKFWFRFVYPNMSDLEMGLVDEVYSKIEGQLNTYYGREFERLVIEQVRLKEIPIPFSFTEVRRWWHKDKEIDLVVSNTDTKEILFIECKWKDLDEKTADRILADLKTKSEFVQWKNDGRIEYYGIVAKKIGGKESLRAKGFMVFDLDDM